MTIVSEPTTAVAPVRPTRASDVLVAVLLVAAELVLAWYTYDLAVAVSHHVSASRPVQWFFLALPYLPLAVVVAVHALSRRRAVAAGLAALGAAVLMIAVYELNLRLAEHPSAHLGYRQVRDIGYAGVMAAAVLCALAWGLSRRHGRRWPVGLLVAAAGAWLTIRTRWPEHVPWGHTTFTTVAGDHGPFRRFYLVHTVADLLPVVAACVVCWLIDRAEQPRRPPGP